MGTIIGVFGNARSAQRGMMMLRDRGLRLHALSIISRSSTADLSVRSVGTVSNKRGAVIGAVWGAILGFVALVLPVIEPLTAGGALAVGASMLIGALIGAAVGGVAAALIHFGGIPQAEAEAYEPLLQTDKTLVAVKVRDEDARHVRRTLSKAGAESVQGDKANAALPLQTNV